MQTEAAVVGVGTWVLVLISDPFIWVALFRAIWKPCSLNTDSSVLCSIMWYFGFVFLFMSSDIIINADHEISFDEMRI